MLSYCEIFLRPLNDLSNAASIKQNISSPFAFCVGISTSLSKIFLPNLPQNTIWTELPKETSCSSIAEPKAFAINKIGKQLHTVISSSDEDSSKEENKEHSQLFEPWEGVLR
uniref:Uncharacterized protein n=1 Tax=Salix viminalis TaxID=40686 RepID=A0A6N2K2P9_SALVM